MQFKPTLTKTITSVLAGFILGLFGGLYIAPKSYCNGEICVDVAFPTELVIISILISVVAIYIVWSLFEKK